MMLKLQGPSSFKTINDNILSNSLKSNLYSPKSFNDSDKLTESFPCLTTTASLSTASYDPWLESYQPSSKLLTDETFLKPISDTTSSNLILKALTM
jgi:hypothetical protein